MLTYHDNWATRSALIKWRSATPPSTVHVCLSTSTTITRSTSKADFLSSELPSGGGYSRKSFTIPADGSFNNTSKYHEFPEVTLAWTATATLQFQSMFLLADAGLGSESIIAFKIESAPVIVYGTGGAPKEFNYKITIKEGLGV